MGQMHVQRAVEHESPPRLVVVTDLSGERLAHTAGQFGPLARQRGIELVCVNPGDYPGQGELERALAEVTGSAGFDDVVLCAPVGGLVGAAVRQAAEGGVVNIFAGLALGTVVELDLDAVSRKRLRVMGSSGSGLEDMLRVVRKLARLRPREPGGLDTGRSLAAVGGLAQALEGLKGLRGGRFPGKTVIYPAVPDLPLSTVSEAAERFPAAGALLEGGSWTRAAEEAFLEEALVFG
jgi:threonine dehydrogenase-like Zn-dependent dehydrogenase